jgi:hypothetical protein
MTDENLGDVLDESYRAHQREVAIRNLGNRTHLTLGQIAKLCEHPQHGEIVASISLDELLAIRAPDEAEEPTPTETTPASSKKKGAKKKGTKKTAKKRAGKKKGTKKTAKKRAGKKKSAKKTAKKGAKADKGKPKPRLDYEKGMKEVLAALKAAKEPVGRSAIEKATGFTGVQVRAFAKRLAADGKIKILGAGGRSTKYAPA